MPTNPQPDPRARIAHALRSITVVGGAPPTRLVPVLDAANPRMARIADWQPLEALVDAVLAAAVPSAPADRAALRQQIAEALSQAAFKCAGECGLDERACYDAHPITWSAMAGGTTHIDASVTAIADVAVSVLATAVDRAAIYREVADRLAADAEQGAKEGFTRIYRRSAAKQVREWAYEAQQQCPGFETQPNRCTCDCEGCRHNCAAHHTDEAQQPNTERTPCSEPPCDDGPGEPCDRHETEQAHADGLHEDCGVTCEVQFPSEQMRNFILAKGYPGTAGMLDELLRRAAAGQGPQS